MVGEVLFDVFPDGSEVLGGAPFNVAWNLRGLGLDPLLIARVGADRRGREILTAMDDWGLDRSGIQIDPALPTGIVQVTLVDDQPSYEISPDQAYDALDGEAAGRVATATEASILVRGTLCARSAPGRTAIARLQSTIDAPVLLDVNLRAPWWDPRQVREALAASTIVKVNEDELFRVVDDRHGFRGTSTDPLDAARALREDHDLDAVVVTRGSDGAAWVGREDTHRATAAAPSEFVDAVGAGDAFTSVIVAGRVAARPPGATLSQAARFAAEVCGIRGATARDRTLYRDARRFVMSGESSPDEAPHEGGPRG